MRGETAERGATRKKKNGWGAWPAEMTGLAASSRHEVLALWAGECAGRVLPWFAGEFPADLRPQAAVEACRQWAAGEIGVAAARRAASAAQAAARDAGDQPAAAYAARAAGHAAACAHARGHALRAAHYAILARRSSGADEEELQAEGEWQLDRLRELNG